MDGSPRQFGGDEFFDPTACMNRKVRAGAPGEASSFALRATADKLLALPVAGLPSVARPANEVGRTRRGSNSQPSGPKPDALSN